MRKLAQKIAVVIFLVALFFPGVSASDRVVFEGMVAVLGEEDRCAPAPAAELRADIRAADFFALSNLLTTPEIYHDFVPHLVDLVARRPVIQEVRCYGGSGPPGMVMSASLAQIKGKNLEATARIFVNREAFAPLVVGTDSVVGKLGGTGPAELWLVTREGVASSKVRVCLIEVRMEEAPPRVLRPGKAYDAALRINGTSAPVGVRLVTSSPAVSFEGSAGISVSSSGGSPNIVKVRLRAERTGRFQITCRLADRRGSRSK